MTKEELFNCRISGINEAAAAAAKNRWDSISKPLDGLGDFETLICQIAGILGDSKIWEFRKALVVMCADNGIVEEGISQCGQENTRLVAKLLGENQSSASTMARFVGARCIPVDVGINCVEELPGVLCRKGARGSRNFLKEPACTEEEVLKAIACGMEMVRDLQQEGINLVAAGEMGIGNTTTGTALACALTGISPEEITGRGAGLSDAGLLRKREVIREGLKKHGLAETDAALYPEEAFRAMCCVGGYDIAAMAGMFIGGAVFGMPVVIDGIISGAAALTAERMVPGCRNFMIPSHAGREKGTGILLEHLGLQPFLNGDMALGEGTGALMVFPLFDMILDFYNTAGTFQDGNIENYVRISS